MDYPIRFSLACPLREFVFGGLINVPLIFFFANTVTLANTDSQKIHLKNPASEGRILVLSSECSAPVPRLALGR